MSKKTRTFRILVFLVLATACACAGTTGEEKEMAKKNKPGVGDAAPPFELPGSDGKTYKLEDFRDRQVVVVAWFPKAFTGG